MKGTKNVKNLLLSVALILLGVIAIVVGISQNLKRNAYLSANATITKIEWTAGVGDDDDTYEVTVRYAVDGKEYTEKLGYHEDGMKEGQTIEIRYNPENPADIVEASSTFSTVMFIVGPIAILLGLFLGFKALTGR